MADGTDKFDDGKPPVAPDASAALIQDTQVGIPQRVADNTAASGDKAIVAATDYSGEGSLVQSRMTGSPQEGLNTANENIRNLTASMSNSQEGKAMVTAALKDSLDFYAQRNPEITKHVSC